MKHFFVAISISILASASIYAQGTPKKATPKPKAAIAKPAGILLKTAIDSFSYALGMNIANNLKQQGIQKISNSVMQRALDDIFNNRKSILDEQQANIVIQQRMQQNMAKKNEVVRSKGMAFLEANKKRPGIVTLPSGLQYEIITKGLGNSALPRIQDTVVAHYRGTLTDGTPFDNSYDRGEPLTIGVGSVISGWTEVLQLMHIGDKWKVFIPSELGYGERGAGHDIPGGAALIFEMELLGIKPPAADTLK